MGHLERGLATPSTAPARVAEVVSSPHSDTADAPWNLSVALYFRLDEIARVHGGRIPLHGRLFAQWMHHAYPRECNFPRVAGATSPLTWEEFEMGEEISKVSKDGINLTFGAPEALP